MSWVFMQIKNKILYNQKARFESRNQLGISHVWKQSHINATLMGNNIPTGL